MAPQSVISTTLQLLRDKLIDNSFLSHPLFRAIESAGNLVKVSGGLRVEQPVIFGEHSSITELSNGFEDGACLHFGDLRVGNAEAAATVPVVMTVHNYRLGCLSADLFRGDDVCTVCVGRTPVRGVVHGCYRGSRALSAVQAFEVMTARRRGVLDEHVSAFVAPSRFMADRLIAIGLPADRLVVKPHFVTDPGRYRISVAT